MYLGVNNGNVYRFCEEFKHNGQEYFVLILDGHDNTGILEGGDFVIRNYEVGDFVIRKYEDEEEYLDVKHYFGLTEPPYNNAYDIIQLEDLIESSLNYFFRENKNENLGVLDLYIKALNNYGKAIFKYSILNNDSDILSISIYWKKNLYEYYYKTKNGKLNKIIKNVEYNINEKRYFFKEGDYHVVVAERNNSYICLDKGYTLYEVEKDGSEVELSIQEYLLQIQTKSNLECLVRYLQDKASENGIKFGINLLMNIYRDENIKITYKRISNQMVLLTFEDCLSKDSEIETMIVNNWFLDLQDGLENVDKYYYFYDKGIQIAKLIKEEKGFYYFENDVKKLIMQVSDSNEIEYLLNKNYAKTVTEVEDMINFLYLNRRLKHKRINVDEIKFFYREYTNFKIDFEKIDNEKTLVTISNITGSEAIVLKISDKIA